MKRPVTSRKSRTDWRRVDALKDDKIDFSDIPELTPGMCASAVVRRGPKPVPRKKQLTLPIDSDVLEWYRRQGKGSQSLMNRLLRASMHERRKNSWVEGPYSSADPLGSGLRLFEDDH